MKLFLGLFLLLLQCELASATIKEDFTSPVTTDAKYVVIGGSLTLVTVLVFKKQIGDPFQSETVEDKPLGHTSTYGDLAGQLIPNALYVLGESVAGMNGNPEGYRRATGMFKASLYSSVVTNALKYTVREQRPNHGARNSFPSGHTTTAFAFAGYVLEEHGWPWGVPALALGTFVGYSRINDNKHYLDDVVAGATIGLGYGIGISKVDRGKGSHNVTFAPIYDHDTKGIVCVAEF